MNHSYEEIRQIALDLLSGRETPLHYELTQYQNLQLSVGEVFAKREGNLKPGQHGGHYPLSNEDKESYLEVFWICLDKELLH